MQELSAGEIQLYRVFSSDYDFHIPDYQRPYAWEEEQALQLLDDLTDALERGDGEPYFLGAVVLVKEKDDPHSEVIDGQQRLTTLTLLLAVLRDHTGDPELKRELGAMIQEPGNLVRELEPKPRLRLRSRDAAFFGAYVQTPGALAALLDVNPDSLASDSQRAIRLNAQALHRALATWGEGRWLDLVRMLSKQTYLVVVSTPDLGSAHRIFSVMNSRGLELSPSDIFKAKVIGDLPEELSRLYADKWEDAEEHLGRSDFADLFNHLRTIVSKERARRELLKEFHVQVLDQFLPGKADQFVDDLLVPYADAYQQMLDRAYTSTHGADAVNNWFRRLDQLDNNDWRAPALWAMRHHGSDPSFLDQFLRALERLAGSMFIRREYTTPRVTRYLELLRQLDAGEGLGASAFELSEQERAETVEGLSGEIYRVGKIRKYVLLRLDEAVSGAAGVTYAHNVITVEHVLPQSVAVDSSWAAVFTDDEHDYWQHRLANLVLLTRYKNSEAQNFDFEKKKITYFSGKSGTSAFALTTQVLATPEWTPGVLQHRQEYLINRLREEWEL